MRSKVSKNTQARPNRLSRTKIKQDPLTISLLSRQPRPNFLCQNHLEPMILETY